MPASRQRRGVALPAALTAAAAAAGGVAVAVWNLLGVAAVLGVLTVALAARIDTKRIAVIGLLAALMSRSIEIGTGVAAATYTDEIVTLYLGVVLVGRRILQQRRLHRPPGIWMFVAFAAFGAASSVVSAVPIGITAAGGILMIKGVVLYFALAQIDWTVDDIGWLTRTGALVLTASLVCSLINLAVPGPWTAVLANTGHPQYRSFLPSLIGPFTHPLELGNFMALAAIACAAPLVFRAGKRGRGPVGLFLGSVVATVLSFRRTAIVGLLAGLALLALRRKHAGVLVTTMLLVPIAAVALYPLIQNVAVATYDNYIVEGSDNARTRLTTDSVALAVEHFPFGVGFGRFGSAIARDHYSPEYVRLGYDAVYGLGSPGNPHNHGRFLTDTQWPAIVGEAGLVGALFFVAGLWGIVTVFRRASRAAHTSLQLLGQTGMGWTVHILILSVAYPVFVTVPTSPLLFGLAAITSVLVAGQDPDPGAVEPGAPDRAQAGAAAEPRALPAGTGTPARDDTGRADLDRR